MSITKSAKKAFRKNIKRRKKNIQRKKKIKALIKEMKSLLIQKKIEEAQKLLPLVYKSLDKTAKGKTIKKNTASRKKSRIAKMINKTSPQGKEF